MLKTSQNICLYGGAQLMISQLHLISSIWVITVLMGAVREYRPLILHSGFKLFCVVVHLRLYINHFKVVFLFNVLIHETLRTRDAYNYPQNSKTPLTFPIHVFIQFI